MGFLDNTTTMSTQSTSSNPWGPQQDYLKEIFTGAQDAYKSEQPSYFPDSSVVGFSPQTEQGLSQIEGMALAGSPLQDSAMQQAQSTVQGDYLNNNQFLQGAYNAAAQPMIDQWQNQIAPGIDSSFSGAGRMGSGLYAQQRNASEDTLSRGLADMGGKMAYQNYSDERNRQQEMIGAAPGMAASRYNDANQMMAVGGAREGLEQSRLQDEMNRFNFEQNRPWDQLAKYSGIVGGGYGSETTTDTPLYSNPSANFLGGAMGGAQLGGSLSGGSAWGSGLGAAAGGLLSLFG